MDEKQYKQSLERIEQIMDAEKNTTEGDELLLLVVKCQEYEEENFKL